MGEYAYHGDSRIKIGTCEELTHLRFDQAHLVQKRESHDTDVLASLTGFLFRFPWPDEDNVEPGAFNDGDRSLGLYGVQPPSDNACHYSIQFADTRKRGLLLSIPCPESDDGKAAGHKVHRNGYAGPVRIKQQRVWEGRLVLVAECGSCGGAYRYPDLDDVQPILDALSDRVSLEAHRDPLRSAYYRTIADRIRAGYTDPPALAAATAPVPADA